MTEVKYMLDCLIWSERERERRGDRVLMGRPESNEKGGPTMRMYEYKRMSCKENCAKCECARWVDLERGIYLLGFFFLFLGSTVVAKGRERRFDDGVGVAFRLCLLSLLNYYINKRRWIDDVFVWIYRRHLNISFWGLPFCVDFHDKRIGLNACLK